MDKVRSSSLVYIDARVGDKVKGFHPRKFGVIDEGVITCKRKAKIWVNYGQNRSYATPLSHIVQNISQNIDYIK